MSEQRLPDKLVVHVTAEHLEQGMPCRTDGCPIALALSELECLSDFNVSVEPSGVVIFSPTTLTYVAGYDLGRSGRRFVRVFDGEGDGSQEERAATIRPRRLTFRRFTW